MLKVNVSILRELSGLEWELRKKDNRSEGRKRVIREEEVEPSKVESEHEVSWDKE